MEIAEQTGRYQVCRRYVLSLKRNHMQRKLQKQEAKSPKNRVENKRQKNQDIEK
jgi:hypothetical protein